MARHVSTFGGILALWGAFWTPFRHLWAPYGTFGAPFCHLWGSIWDLLATILAPCGPIRTLRGGFGPTSAKRGCILVSKSLQNGAKKSSKTSKTRHQKRDRKTHRKYLQKASQKYPKKESFRNVLEQKTSLHPKGPHSLKPTYFLRNNEVHVGQRSERIKKKLRELREHAFPTPEKTQKSISKNIKTRHKKDTQKSP